MSNVWPLPAAGQGPFRDNEGLRDAERLAPYEWFETTDQLTQIRDFAFSLMINPWAAMLGVLIRFSADIPPTVVLPGLNGGSQGSLNLFGVLAGKSGAGKSDLLKAIDEWFLPRPQFAADDPVTSFSIGTGEGIAARFVQMRKPEDGPANAAMVPTQVAHMGLMEIDEISMLDKLAERPGQTIVDTLKTLWTSGRLVPALASPERQRPLEAHTYRLSLYMGAQPGLGKVLFSKESRLGGFVQRFLFATLRDPQLRLDSKIPDPPAPLVRHVNPNVFFPHGEPFGGKGIGLVGRAKWVLPVDPEITKVLLAETLRRRTGDDTALDGHLLFTKLRVAAVLAIMHGHDNVDKFWFDLAEGIMAHSMGTHEALVKAISVEAYKDRVAQATNDGEMDVIRVQPKVQAAATKFASIARNHAAAHEGCGKKCFSNAGSHYRPFLSDAIDLAEKQGILVPFNSDVAYNGVTTKWKAGAEG